ncbi:MAG: DUF1634 domain-containing protein [Actinobacteria bacterium]|nr:DUF1634 domain-containing protein [Actinomycetota bacterium]
MKAQNPRSRTAIQHYQVDERTEKTLGRVLQIGVLSAGIIVFGAGIAYLVHHGGDAASFKNFQVQPQSLRSPLGIFRALTELRASSFIQLGLLVLIATPIVRVVLSAYSFARLRDFLYVLVTLIVLTVLAFGLISSR